MGNQPATISRRGFFALASLAALSLPGCGREVSTAGVADEKRNSAEIDKIIFELDPALGKAEHQVRVKNPCKVIFVVNEAHYAASELDTNQLQAVDRIQELVRRCVLKIQEQYPTTLLYKDGMHKEIAEAKMSQARYIREAEQIPLYAEVLNNPEMRGKLISALRAGDQKNQELAERLEMIIGLREDLKHDAAFRLAYEGRVTLQGAEERQLIERSLKIAHEDPNALSNPEFISTAEQRDDFAVRQAINNPGRDHIFIFGQLHDFRTNIENHNQRNPDKQIYLIKITPAGLDEFVKSLLDE